MSKSFEFDTSTLKEIPFIKTDVPIDLTESQNKIMDHIIQSLPPDNGRHYIEHEEGSNIFKIREDPHQKDKDRLFELILISYKKLCRSKKKAERAELKRVKNQAIHMLEDLGET